VLNEVRIVWAFYGTGSDPSQQNQLWIGLLRGDATEPIKAEQWLAASPKKGTDLKPGEVPFRFDFGAYNLGKLGRAIGVRTSISGCGAGGSLCAQTDLLLFAIVDNALTKVFDAQVAHFRSYSRKPKDDDEGTPERLVEEQEGVVLVVNKRGQPIPDIETRRRDRKRDKQRFVWAQEKSEPGQYKTDDAAIMDTALDN
jgi:hypothetical protein